MDADTFTALDFETAQGYRWSVCQVGLVRIVGGKCVERLSILVQPPGNRYWPDFTSIHGIGPEDTAAAPNFAAVWPGLRPYIESQTVVAHNMAFDNSCLKQSLEYHSLETPEYITHCTYRIYRKNLAALCSEFGIHLNHHDALSDAEACARLYLRHLGG